MATQQKNPQAPRHPDPLRDRYNRMVRAAGAEGRFVRTRTGRVHVIESGDGPPVVHLHGNNTSSLSHLMLLDHTTATHSYLVDRPGFGLSDPDTFPLSNFRQCAVRFVDGVLDVVHRIGDVVGPVHHLSLQARLALGRARPHPIGCRGIVLVEPELAIVRSSPPRVFRHRIQPGPGEVQPGAVILGAKDFRLQAGEDAEVLRVALEAAMLGGQLVQGPFAVVAVWRMADVVGQPGHVDEVGIAAKADRHATPDLRHLQRVGQPGPWRVTLAGPDDLRLVRQPAQGRTVQDPGPVPGEIGSVFVVGARQRGSLRRFDHETLAVELLVEI